MGRDKATLTIAGRAMATWVAEAMRRSGIEHVVALGGSDAVELPVVPDLAVGPACGPLAMLIGALDRCGDLLICPCDVPAVPSTLFERLLHAADISKRSVVLASSDQLEPLIGVYRASALPLL